MYFHSVTLDKEKCKGCTNCIKRCPTEAIRVRKGKARIIQERSIDCGECIRICPNHAKDHLVLIQAPMEVAARAAKKIKSRELGLEESDIGTFFITPCPAKVTAVKQPFGDFSYVDGTIAISAIYGVILREMENIKENQCLQKASGRGICWGRAGGENLTIGKGSLLAVDGIHSVISVLEEIERGGLNDIDYLEAQACTGGCIGGPLVIQNPFVARVRIRDLVNKYARANSASAVESLAGFVELTGPVLSRPVLKLDDNIAAAISKMELLESTLKELPDLDCGSCGSPNCRALAEDIVRGMANETYCLFKLRDRVQVLAEEMVELAQNVPPAMGRIFDDKDEEEGEAGDLPR